MGEVHGILTSQDHFWELGLVIHFLARIKSKAVDADSEDKGAVGEAKNGTFSIRSLLASREKEM